MSRKNNAKGNCASPHLSSHLTPDLPSSGTPQLPQPQPSSSPLAQGGQRAGWRITVASLVLNFLLGTSKTGIGFFANSGALVADGLNSLSDLSTDIVALFGLKMANKPEDDNHLYGHHKFASLSSLFISGMVLIVCVGLVVSSGWALLHTEPVLLGWLPFTVAVLSMVSKWLMHRKTRTIARRTGSRILEANALNQRTDAFSSGLVLVALAAVWLGGQQLAFIDKAMGMVMGVWFGIAVIKMIRESLDDLLDAAPEKAMLDDIREHILPVQGAESYHKFRSRRVGDRFEVDMHLQVEPELTVEQGHEIASAVRDNILRQHPEVITVLIHIEPAQGRHMEEKGISDREEDKGEENAR